MRSTFLVAMRKRPGSSRCGESRPKRATSLLSYGFVKQNEMPIPAPIRYSQGLLSLTTFNFCREIVDEVVGRALGTTGLQQRPRSVGRPRKSTPSSLDLPHDRAREEAPSLSHGIVQAEDADDKRKKRTYHKWTDDQKDLAISTANKFGQGGRASAVRFLQLNFPNIYGKLTESHVRYWTKERATSPGPRGTPPTVCGDLLSEITTAVKSQCETGIVVNSTLLRPLIISIIERRNKSILQEYGGCFTCSVSWINKLCCALNLTMRRATTAAQKLPDDWELKGENLMLQLAYFVVRHNIPPALVVNLDQSAMQLLPMRETTRKGAGSMDVPLVGIDDKRQITAVFQVAATGAMLPPQLIFQGKTKRCLPAPAIREPLEDSGWDFTYSTNHWANQTTMTEIMAEVISPYLMATKQTLGLQPKHKAVLLLDCWKVHRSAEFQNFLKRDYSDVIPLFIPAGCTSKLQVVDLVVNGQVKSVVKQHVAQYLSNQASEQMNQGIEAQHVKFDLRLSVLKPKLVFWLKAAVDSLQPETIKRGWDRAKLLNAWKGEWQAKALQNYEEGRLFPHDHNDFEPELDVEDLGD